MESLSDSNRLEVHLIGTFTLRFGHQMLKIPSRKARALIGFLALSDSGEESRDRIVGMFWSESDQVKARASLRQVTREIRKAFDAMNLSGFHSNKQTVALDPESIRVDVIEIQRQAQAGRTDRLLQRHRLTDRLLSDLDWIDPAFHVWVLAKRQSLCNQLTSQMEDTLRNATSPSKLKEQVARALINLDPTHEEAVRELMKARALAGDIGGALGAYKDLWTILDEEYEVEPSEPTQNLVAALKLGQFPGEPRSSSEVTGPAPAEASFESEGQPPRSTLTEVKRGMPPKLLISVAGFDTLGIRAELQYLVQGFRRELIACLVRFREWAVRETGKSNGQRPPKVAVKAEYVIDGSAMEGPGSLRFVLMLRETSTDEYLWSENVDVSVENWFQAQQIIVRRIATALNVHVSVGRMSGIIDRSVSDLKAFDAWLLGQATFLSFDPQRWNKAAEHFLQVIEDMPGFAPAYSSLAQLYNSQHIVMPGVFRDAARTEKALTCAREAARLDPVDSRSQLCLGWSHAMAKQHEQAMIYIPLAYELNDNDPWTMVSAANCLAFCGQYDRAQEIAARALELPLAPSNLQWSYHVAIRFMCGDYQGCVDAADSVADVNPNVPGYKAAALYHQGRKKEASEELERFYGLARDRWTGEAPATEKSISRWFLTMFPIAKPDDWSRLRDGLAGAGAPTEGLHHNEW